MNDGFYVRSVLTHWGRDEIDTILLMTFPNAFSWNVWISIEISLKFILKGIINNIPALVQIMAWNQPGDKPSSEPMMIILLTHICVTRRQWVQFNLFQLWQPVLSNTPRLGNAYMHQWTGSTLLQVVVWHLLSARLLPVLVNWTHEKKKEKAISYVKKTSYKNVCHFAWISMYEYWYSCVEPGASLGKLPQVVWNKDCLCIRVMLWS